MRQGLASLPAAKRKRQLGKSTGPNRTRTSRRASSLGSLTDVAGPSSALALTTDLDCCTSCARGWPPCPLRSEKRQGGKTQAPPTMGHAGPSTGQASTTDIDCFTSCARGWPPCPLRSEKRQGGKNSGPAHNGSCWTLDWSGIDYGHRLLHIMRQGLASLPAAKRKKARREKLRPRPRCVMLDPRLILHRLRTSTTAHHRVWPPCPL